MTILGGGGEPAPHSLHEFTLIVLCEGQNLLERRWSTTSSRIAVEGRKHPRHSNTGWAILGLDGASTIPEQQNGKHHCCDAKLTPSRLHPRVSCNIVRDGRCMGSGGRARMRTTTGGGSHFMHSRRAAQTADMRWYRARQHIRCDPPSLLPSRQRSGCRVRCPSRPCRAVGRSR